MSGDGSESGDAGARFRERFLFCMTSSGAWNQVNWRNGLGLGRAVALVTVCESCDGP